MSGRAAFRADPGAPGPVAAICEVIAATRLAPGDAREIVALCKANMAAIYDATGGDWIWDENRKATQLLDPAARFVVARDPSRLLAGFAQIAASCEDGLWVGYLYELQVRSDLQGRGLGSDLLYRAERLAGAAGLTELRLTCLRANPAALRFYRRRGYRTVPFSRCAVGQELFRSTGAPRPPEP